VVGMPYWGKEGGVSVLGVLFSDERLARRWNERRARLVKGSRTCLAQYKSDGRHGAVERETTT